MGLFSSVKKHFLMQLIGIVLEEDKCGIYVKKIRNEKVIYSNIKYFNLESKDNFTKEIVSYLNTLQNEHEQTYVALFLNTLGQGAICGCKKEAFEKFGVDAKSVKGVCIDKDFTIYASIIDINWANTVFEKVGLDFIFSPFLILNSYAKKDISSDEVKLYILNTNNGLTMMIMGGKKFLYGSFFNVGIEENVLLEDFESASSEVLSVDDEEIFEELDLDDVDDEASLMNIDEMVDYEEGILQNTLSEKDARFVRYLDTSLKEFYSSDNYDSEFVSSVKIYDCAGMNEDVIKHIEDELLLDISAENINLLEAVVEISKKEVMSNA